MMKIRPIYNFNYLPPGTEAMVLYPFILLRSDTSYYFNQHRGKVYLRHELQHVYQIRKAGYFFYVKYIAEWLYNLLKYRDADIAYEEISYEIEARQMEGLSLTEQEWKHFRAGL